MEPFLFINHIFSLLLLLPDVSVCLDCPHVVAGYRV